MRKLRWMFVALAASALLAACGGDGDKSSDTPAAGKAAPVATNTVNMKDIQFDPKEITVKVGQKITWTNEDSATHNVVAESGAEFTSDNFGQGGTYSFSPKEAGTIKYECTLHPGMEGSIEVTE
ncbi:MAG TPA: plastocyanin/azurin family copper-binding protein [Baekduia sp.]|nr:plastocyanin/azurin family copper-binding protein [Baekduia sp.]